MNKTLLIALALALIIVGGAVSYVKKEPGAKNDSAQEQDLSACAQGEQCIVVDNHCGFCCEYTAINAKHEMSFSKSFDKRCKRYMGEYCSCFDLSSYPSCVKGKCKLVKWPDERNQQTSPADQQQSKPQQAAPPQEEQGFIDVPNIDVPSAASYEDAPQAPVEEIPLEAPAAVPALDYNEIQDFDEDFGDIGFDDEPDLNAPIYEPPSRLPSEFFDDESQSNQDDWLNQPLPDQLPEGFERPMDNSDPLNRALPEGNTP